PDQLLPLWDLTVAKREPLARVDRIWRGTVMDTYALEKITGWTPELSPPPDTPFFRWRVLADNAIGLIRIASNKDRDKRQFSGEAQHVYPDGSHCAGRLRSF